MLDFPRIVTLPRLPGPLEFARLLYEHTVREHRGILEITTAKGPIRLQLGAGFVYALDAGPDAPVSPESQVRYVLRARGTAHFHLGKTLSARFFVEPFRPDFSIRAHIEAQHLSPEKLRQRIGSNPVTVSFPPHPSALFPGEQAVLDRLLTAASFHDLCSVCDLPPTRILQLLLFLDALGVLVVGMTSRELAQAFALLDLSKHATHAEVKSAYRRLARTLHPDQFPTATPTEKRALSDRFSAIHNAYRVLLHHVPNPVDPHDSHGPKKHTAS